MAIGSSLSLPNEKPGGGLGGGAAGATAAGAGARVAGAGRGLNTGAVGLGRDDCCWSLNGFNLLKKFMKLSRILWL